MNETGIPSERHRNRAATTQVHGQRGVGDRDVGRRGSSALRTLLQISRHSPNPRSCYRCPPRVAPGSSPTHGIIATVMTRNSGQAESHGNRPAVARQLLKGRSVDERSAQITADADWEEMVRRLLTYARSRQAHYGLRGDAKTPEDYVNEAIYRTLEGRPYLGREVALFAFLARVVDSLISHDAEPTKIPRTIQPAAGRSRVSAEEARAAARLVYRDRKTGRFVILDREPSARKPNRAKRSARRSYPRDAAKQAEGPSRHPASPPVKAKKR
jgi:hypothetical protein